MLVGMALSRFGCCRARGKRSRKDEPHAETECAALCSMAWAQQHSHLAPAIAAQASPRPSRTPQVPGAPQTAARPALTQSPGKRPAAWSKDASRRRRLLSSRTGRARGNLPRHADGCQQIGLPAPLDQRNSRNAFAQAIIAAGTERCATRCWFPSSYSYRGR